LLTSLNENRTYDYEEELFLDSLREKHIIADESEDRDYFDEMQFQSQIRSFSQDTLGLTIAPTIQCNLRCPYCFESSKPKGIMTQKVCDEIIKFMESHQVSKYFNVTWFGGEPLLASEPIKYLMDKFDGLDNLKFLSNSIITNGTLISKKTLSAFEKKPLNSAQITFDGLKNSHDSKRRTASGKGSFDLILKNISLLHNISPQTTISLRVNVDKNNAGEFLELRKMLLDRFSDISNLNIYPAVVRGDFNCNTTLFTAKDQIDFYNYLSENGVPMEKYPTLCSKGCSATHIGSYVIGPNGELYLCWEHVGKSEYIVGNISEITLSNPSLFRQYRMNGLCFSDKRCKSCALLPICDGGCPDKRIDNAFRGGTNNLCNIYHTDNNEALYQLLYNIYKRYYENPQ